ncbi:uncharacterized [Tachysurus ichikawai]
MEDYYSRREESTEQLFSHLSFHHTILASRSETRQLGLSLGSELAAHSPAPTGLAPEPQPISNPCRAVGDMDTRVMWDTSQKKRGQTESSSQSTRFSYNKPEAVEVTDSTGSLKSEEDNDDDDDEVQKTRNEKSNQAVA